MKISETQMQQLEVVLEEAEIDALVAFAREHVLEDDSPLSGAALSARVRKLAGLARGWGAEQPSTVERVVALGLALGAPLFDENEEVVRCFEEARDEIDEAVFHFYMDLCDGLEQARGGGD